jgi:hypothetical protein
MVKKEMEPKNDNWYNNENYQPKIENKSDKKNLPISKIESIYKFIDNTYKKKIKEKSSTKESFEEKVKKKLKKDE